MTDVAVAMDKSSDENDQDTAKGKHYRGDGVWLSRGVLTSLVVTAITAVGSLGVSTFNGSKVQQIEQKVDERSASSGPSRAWVEKIASDVDSINKTVTRTEVQLENALKRLDRVEAQLDNLRKN